MVLWGEKRLSWKKRLGTRTTRRYASVLIGFDGSQPRISHPSLLRVSVSFPWLPRAPTKPPGSCPSLSLPLRIALLLRLDNFGPKSRVLGYYMPSIGNSTRAC